MRQPERALSLCHLVRSPGHGSFYRQLRHLSAALVGRLASNSQQQYYVIAILVGVLCGLAAVAFHHSIDWSERHLINNFAELPPLLAYPLLILSPAIGGLIVGFLIRHWAPDAAGSGIPQVKAAYFLKFGRISLMTGVKKFILGTLSIGSGNSLGREGPTVQIAASIASWVGRMFGLAPRRLMTLVPLGAAAGIAAAFNTPLAAIVFAIEEVMGDLNHRALAGIVLVAVISAVIERSLLGANAMFTIPPHAEFRHADLLWALALGLAAGLLSHIWVEGLLRLRQGARQAPSRWSWTMPGFGGLATGLLGTAVFAGTGHLGVFGIGYSDLSAALAGKLALSLMLLLFVGKFGATIFSYSSGGSGGIFAPTLFMGAMLGGAIGFGAERAFSATPTLVGPLALVGMGAMFAGVIRAPVTSILIIFELTGDYSLILPIMLANLAAYGVASRLREIPVYEALLLQDGVNLRKFPILSAGRTWQKLPVKSITTHDVVTMKGSDTIKAALKKIEHKTYKSYPVLSDDGALINLVHRKFLEAAPDHSIRVDQHLPRRVPIPCYHDQTIREVAHLFVSQEFLTLPVVSRIDPKRLLGVVTLHDITRQQFLQEIEH